MFESVAGLYGFFKYFLNFSSITVKEVKMIRRRFRCRRCGCKFETEVLEPGEVEEKRLPSGPVTCPECKSTDIERI